MDGADDMPNCPRGNFSAAMGFMFSSPSLPKPGTGRPVFAFSEISQPSLVPNTICGGSEPSPGQYATPRSAGACPLSYSQIFFPVSGSSASTREYPVERYITPPTTIGVLSDRRCRPPRPPATAGPPRPRPRPLRRRHRGRRRRDRRDRVVATTRVAAWRRSSA